MGVPRSASSLAACIPLGAANAFLLFLWDYLRFRYTSDAIALYPLAGFGIALFGLWGEDLWRMLVRPSVEGKGPALQFFSRIPVWFMAGGIGYVAGLLAAKKFGLLSLYERPIRSFFLAGAYAGILLQAFAALALTRLGWKGNGR